MILYMKSFIFFLIFFFPSYTLVCSLMILSVFSPVFFSFWLSFFYYHFSFNLFPFITDILCSWWKHLVSSGLDLYRQDGFLSYFASLRNNDTFSKRRQFFQFFYETHPFSTKPDQIWISYIYWIIPWFKYYNKINNYLLNAYLVTNTTFLNLGDLRTQHEKVSLLSNKKCIVLLEKNGDTWPYTKIIWD